MTVFVVPQIVNEVVTAAPRTSTLDPRRFTTQGAAYVEATIHVTAITGAPSVQLTLTGVYTKQGSSTQSILLATTAPITSTGFTRLLIGPTVVPAANNAVAVFVPPIVEVGVTHGNSDSITYRIFISLGG